MGEIRSSLSTEVLELNPEGKIPPREASTAAPALFIFDNVVVGYPKDLPLRGCKEKKLFKKKKEKNFNLLARFK